MIQQSKLNDKVIPSKFKNFSISIIIKTDVTDSLTHNVAFSYVEYIFVVCGSIWKFLTVLPPRI